MRLKYAEVISEAWELAAAQKKLTWLVFGPSMAFICILVAEIAYQYFMIFEEFGRFDHGFTFGKIGNGISFLVEHGLIGWAILLGVFLVVFTFLFPAWIEGTLILSIRQTFLHPHKQLSLRQKIIEGFEYFFSLFEYHAVVSPFKLLSIVFYGLTFYRYYHGDLFEKILFPGLIVFFLFSLVINFFLSYASYYIVTEGVPFGAAIRKSIALVFLNLGTTLVLMLLMLLVNLRVFINIFFVLGVPAGVWAVFSYFTKSVWVGIATSGAIIVGVVILCFVAYLTSVLEVFSTAVWARSFAVLRAQQEALSSPEEEGEPETAPEEPVESQEEKKAVALEENEETERTESVKPPVFPLEADPTTHGHPPKAPVIPHDPTSSHH
jgi:hypothetical protein